METSMNTVLQMELIADLEVELKQESTYDPDILEKKVRNAIREVQSSRKYPSYYTQEQIESDMYNFYSNIRNIALYDYGKIGAEGQKSHSENNVSRSYEDRNSYFYGVIPISKL